MKKIVLEQLGRLQRRALEASTDKLRSNCIIAADMIVCDLLFTGAIDDAEADGLMRDWTETYARERLEQAPAGDRLAALWRRGDIADFISREDRVAMIVQATDSNISADQR